MGLAVAQIASNTTTGNGVTATFANPTAAGSMIVVIGITFNKGAAFVNGDVTDSKSNTYSIDRDNHRGTGLPGVGIWENNGGTRGSSHTVTFNDATGTNIVMVAEVTGQVASSALDTGTGGSGTSTGTPFNVAAGGAITGNQIAFYGVAVDSGATATWTDPTGYTQIGSQGNGAGVIGGAWYKINETGTPTVGAGWTGGGVGAGAEIIVTYKEAVASGPTPPVISTPITFPAPAVIVPSVVFIGEAGTATSNASGTTLAITATRDIEVGDFLLIAIAADNAGTSGAARTVTCADNSSQSGTANTYNSTQANRTQASGASDGTTATILRSNLTRKILTGDVVTITFSGTLTAKVTGSAVFRNAFGPNISSNTGTGSSTAPTAASTPTAAGQLTIGIVAVEGGTADTFTQDSDTTNGSWVGLTRVGIGTTTSGQTLNWAYKIVNASGIQTYNPTLGTSRDWAEICQTFPFNVTAPAPNTALLTPISFPAPSVSTAINATATPSLISTPITFPAPTIISSPTVALAVLATPITFPSVTVTAGGNATATPPVLATPVTFPSLTVIISVTVAGPLLSTPITFPALTITVSRTATPAVLATPITFPAPSITSSPTKVAGVVSTPITFPSPSITQPPTYATSVSANGRYLRDQNNAPYFVQGNSPQNGVTTWTLSQWETFFTEQAAKGFNSAQIHAVFNFDPDAETSTNPFGTNGNLSPQNANYWATVDSIIDKAANHSFTVWFTIIDNISCGSTVASVSDANCTSYGTFLGNRYKTKPNIVWVVGNDFDSTQWTARNPKYKKITDAIAAAGDTHLLTVWNNTQPGNANTFWDTLQQIDNGYEYDTPPYYQADTSYSLSRTGFPKPFVWFEGTYAGEKNALAGPPNATDLELRKLAWWTVTWGGCGHFFGTHQTWGGTFSAQQTEETTFATAYTQIGYVASKFGTLTGWQLLVPDQSHVFQTGGRGTFEGGSFPALDNDNFSTSAFVNGGQLAVTYFPTSRGSITFDTTKLAGTVSAYWLDPTTGTTSTESNPAAPTHPGNNAAGQGDWVLVHTSTGATNATPTAPLISTPITFPAQTIISSPTVAAPVLSTPISFPAPTISLSRTATAPLLSTPISFPATTEISSPTASAPVVLTPISFVAVTVISSPTATAPLLSTPITFASVTIVSSPTAPAPLLATPITFPAATTVISATATPPVLLTPITFLAPSIITGGSATAQAPLLATPISFPAQAIVISVTLIAPLLATPVTFPAQTISVSRTAVAPLLSTPITFPLPSIQTSSGAMATPPLISTPVSFPAASISTGSSATAPAPLLSTPVTFPITIIGLSPFVQAPQVLTPISFPSPTSILFTFASGPRVLLSFVFPSPAIHADQRPTAPLLVLRVVFPSPHADTGVFTVVVPIRGMASTVTNMSDGGRRMSRSTFPTDPSTG